MKINTIKAVGDWTLDVLAIPYGGQNAKDLDGEYFTAETDLSLAKFPDPLVLYHHGTGQDQAVSIGDVISHEVRKDGLWVRVKLDQASQYAERVWRAAKRGLAAASSGSIAHLVRKAKDGFISAWPFVELSLFDIDKSQSRLPANPSAVAIPAKSVYSLGAIEQVYKEAGRTLPDIESEDSNQAILARAREIVAEIDHWREQCADTEPSALETLMEQTAQAVTGQDTIKVRRVKPDPHDGAELNGVCKFVKDGDTVILVDPDLGLEREYKCYLHEVAHSLKHQPDRNPILPKAVKEWEADQYMGFLDLISTELVKEEGQEPGEFPTITKMVALMRWAEQKRS